MTDAPLVIVNPRAGGGRAGRTIDALVRTMTDVLGPIEAVRTDRPRHATELAEHAAREGRETVIVVGGDGSIHEVVNGLMRARKDGHDKTRLGIVGQGTGGDFRKTFGIEHRLDRYLDVIQKGKTRAIDVGAFTSTTIRDEKIEGWFVNILSAGIGGLVDTYVHQGSTMLGGKAAYFLASARGLLESVVGELVLAITVDGKTETREVRTRQIAICNGRYFGSGMHVGPMADPADGAFDVVDLGAPSKLVFATLSNAIYAGTHVSRPGVQTFRCQKLTMTLRNQDARSRFLLDVDGEPLGGLPLEVELVPGAISLFVP